MDAVKNATTKLTHRRFRDGDSAHQPWREQIFVQDTSYKCPVYVHRTPPCQASCPSGEDIRGWLNIVRGKDKPPAGMAWQEYAFRRLTEANPFPAMMGRVCPAPCQEGCNRNEVEDFVGINAVEQFIGDWALQNGLAFPKPERESGRRVAIIGGGPAGLAAAYQLRRMGHGATIFEANPALGGMVRYGIPGYRTPRDVLDGETQRILDLGVAVHLGTRVGRDVTLDELRRDFDAVFVGVGAQSGHPLPVPGADAPNCVSGVAFLRAFNDGRMRYVGNRVVVVGGGDTAMDVAAVARRLGHIRGDYALPRPEAAVLGQLEHDVATVAQREGAEVVVAYRRTVEEMPAARHEIEAVTREGVHVMACVAPVEVRRGADGRATALRVIKVDWVKGKMVPQPGSEFDIPCDLVVSALGQGGDLAGLEALDNGKGLIGADRFYRVPGQERTYVGGDIVKPHLLTTAIGHARIAAESIDRQLAGDEPGRRPKVDVHHFNLLEALRQAGHEPEAYDHRQERGTDAAGYAVHNYEDRSAAEIIHADQLFLGHFPYVARHQRAEQAIDAGNVLGHFAERIAGLPEKEARAEAERCMSCGMCFECDNCVIFCPQTAVQRTRKKDYAFGRYVFTDYTECIGCHICADVCPTGYIQMGLGE